MAYDQIAKLGRILTVWAHPDDETWYMGGVMAAARANDQAVCCITATRGEGGTKDPQAWPPERLAALRSQEMQDAMDVLGVSDLHWLGIVDGTCANADEPKTVAKISEQLRAFQPDTVFTFGPAGSSGHPDHMAVSAWTTLALDDPTLSKRPQLYHAIESTEWYESVGKKLDEAFNFFHNIDMPPLVDRADMDLGFQLDKALLDKKVAALGCHTSQMKDILASLHSELGAAFGFEGFILAKQ